MFGLGKQFEVMKEEARKAIPYEQIIVEAMKADGFPPPEKGESRASYMQKIANYIKYIKGIK